MGRLIGASGGLGYSVQFLYNHPAWWAWPTMLAGTPKRGRTVLLRQISSTETSVLISIKRHLSSTAQGVPSLEGGIEKPSWDPWSQLPLACSSPRTSLPGITHLHLVLGTCADKKTQGGVCVYLSALQGEGPWKASCLSFLQAESQEGIPPGLLHV